MANDQSSQMTGKKPLVSDVDGTLLRTDLLYETFWAALGQNLWLTMRVLLANWTNPAQLKHKLHQIAEPDIELVPVRLSVLDRLLAALDDGRSVYLVSGSDQILVKNLAARFGLEGDHYGSENGCNLSGKTKGEFLKNKFGEGGYDYIGNGSADMPSWMGAQNVIAVTSSAALKKELSRLPNPVEIEEARFDPKALLKELRPLQWIKNTLLFLPLLAVHSTDASSYLQVAVAAIGFSLGASSIYILNDLLDLSSDRSHPEKRNRPIASGDLSIPSAMLASVCIAIFALVLVWLVSPVGAVLTLTYMASSLVYSLWLKKFRWLDILALAGLFLLRVVTGVEVAQVEASGYLLVFVFGTFFTLACVKRMTALARLVKMDHLPGRRYKNTDLENIFKAAHAGIAVAVLALFAYAFSPEAAGLYTYPYLLIATALSFGAWLYRVVQMGRRGKEDYDPVKFVFSDWGGLIIVGLSISIAVLAI